MEQKFFPEMYADLQMPVIVCQYQPTYPVVYMNVHAGILFSPSTSVDKMLGKNTAYPLGELLRFQSPTEYEALSEMIRSVGHVERFHCRVITFDDKQLTVLLYANAINCGEQPGYIVLYLLPQEWLGRNEEAAYDRRLTAIINATLLTNDVDSAVNMVLALSGQQMKVSRAYVFEEISATTTRNTYEWCAPDIKPAIQTLQNLAKADYNYDVIVDSGMYIAEDVRELPPGDREILEMQGICSLALITIYDNSQALGYVGFDDCHEYRSFSREQIQFLQGAAALIAMLIKRRKAEEKAALSQSVLEIITDNLDDIIYANSLDDYTLKFVSRSLCQALGKTSEEMIGKKCYEIFRIGQTAPCDFCPINEIEFDQASQRSSVYIWEQDQPLTGKTYMTKDIIVKWVDGSYVHVETAIDISTRIEHEQKLEYYASTDVMTGIYKREWGGRLLAERLQQERDNGSLCFIDIDGLKKTNDTYGHDAGDTLLTQCVDFIRRSISGDEIFCRWGGDEFLLCLNCPPDEAERRLNRVQEQMHKYNRSKKHPFQLSFSYGIVALNHGDNASLDALVTAADALMYQDKMEKRGQSLRRRRTD